MNDISILGILVISLTTILIAIVIDSSGNQANKQQCTKASV